MSDIAAAVRAVAIALALTLALIAWDYAASANMACVEDMACWDCSTMGNRICGPEGVTP